jgi:hypothetical protein
MRFSIRRSFVLVIVGLVALMLAPMPTLAHRGSHGSTHVIDFTDFGQGVFDPYFFADEGIIFDTPDPNGGLNWFVGYVQGDEALINDISASFKRPITSLSVSFAPSSYGPIEYTLTAFAPSGRVVATKTVTFSQPPFGYFTIDLGRLPRKAKSFEFTVTNPGPGVGVNTIRFTTEGR